MPWRECSVMEERLRFVARLLDGEGMSDVCREFGISRKTGYKVWDRYRQEGLEALCDRSRRPVRYANQLPEPVSVWDVNQAFTNVANIVERYQTMMRLQTLGGSLSFDAERMIERCGTCERLLT